MTTARRLALLFGVMALLTLCLEGAGSIVLSFQTLQEDAVHDAVGLGRLAAGLLRAPLLAQDAAKADELLSGLQASQDTVHFGWRWVDGAQESSADGAKLVAGEAVAQMQGTLGNTHVLALVPLKIGTRLAIIQVDDDVSLQAGHVLRVAVTVLVLIVLLAGAFLVVGDWLGARLVGRPVQRLIDLSESVGKGDLSARAEAKGEDELALLGRALNHMAMTLDASHRALEVETRARLDAADRLRHADRLVTVGRLSAGVAHELGTPLNVVLLRAQMIAGLDHEVAEKHAKVIEAQVANMVRIVKQLMGFARKGSSTPAPVDVGTTLHHVLDFLRPSAQTQKVDLQLEVRDACVAFVDQQSLQQVVSNLVMNAIGAMPTGGVVTVACARENQAGGPPQWCRVEVRDTGPGLPNEVRERLFEPFVTTKPVGSGTGLGLSVAWGLVSEWGGRLEVSPPGEPGCRFTCYLPLAAQ